MKTEEKDWNVECFYKERPYGRELIAIDNGESRMAMREWDSQYLIDLKNMATGESLQFVVEARELTGKETVLDKELLGEYHYRQHVVETIMYIFWDMQPLEPLENKILQLNKICCNVGIPILEISHHAPNFKKTIVYTNGMMQNHKILRRDFVVGKHETHVPVRILQA